MVLVVDVGNSRMKWALYDPRGWLAQGVVPNAEILDWRFFSVDELPRDVSPHQERNLRAGLAAMAGAPSDRETGCQRPG